MYSGKPESLSLLLLLLFSSMFGSGSSVVDLLSLIESVADCVGSLEVILCEGVDVDGDIDGAVTGVRVIAVLVIGSGVVEP